MFAAVPEATGVAEAGSSPALKTDHKYPPVALGILAQFKVTESGNKFDVSKVLGKLHNTVVVNGIGPVIAETSEPHTELM